jgi:hypothetical protein
MVQLPSCIACYVFGMACSYDQKATNLDNLVLILHFNWRVA